jgi:hypothetical protein
LKANKGKRSIFPKRHTNPTNDNHPRKSNISDASVTKLGKALRKHGYNRIMRNNSYVYAVNFLDYDIVDHKNKDSGESPKSTKTKRNSL